MFVAYLCDLVEASKNGIILATIPFKLSTTGKALMNT